MYDFGPVGSGGRPNSSPAARIRVIAERMALRRSASDNGRGGGS